VWSIREREPVKLSLLHHPLCVSFSYYDSGNIVVLDATAVEEKVREGEMVISVNKFGEVCQMAKYGGMAIDAVTLLSWTQIAVDKVKAMTAFIQQKLVEDEKRRDVGGLIAELSAENERPENALESFQRGRDTAMV
jgi:exosome complex component RRP45